MHHKEPNSPGQGLAARGDAETCEVYEPGHSHDAQRRYTPATLQNGAQAARAGGGQLGQHARNTLSVSRLFAIMCLLALFIDES